VAHRQAHGTRCAGAVQSLQRTHVVESPLSGLIVTNRRPWRRAAVLAVAVLAPLLLFATLSWHEAVHRQRREAALVARSIQSQVVVIVSDAREAVRSLAPLAVQPCNVLMPELLRRTAMVPYVRSLNVVDGDHVSCSSALGVRSSPLSTFYGLTPEDVRHSWAMLIGGTPLVPDRPALLIGEPVGQTRAVFAIVDDRYLMDLLHAVAPLQSFREVELRIGAGTATVYGVTHARSGDVTPPLVDVNFYAAGTPVSLRIHGLRSRLIDTWTGLLQQSMPIAIVLAGLLAWLYYQREMNRVSPREQLLEAIRDDQFYVVYQPVYSVPDRCCAGVEALLRWNRPDGAVVSPDVFIEAAEQSQVVVPLTLHLLERVAADVREWNTAPGFHLGINFAAEHLSDERFVSDLRPFMAELAQRQCQISLEITERSLMKNTAQARRNLDTLRAEGAEVAIDDFGTGYCSLSYLETFPFDLLKVDRGFVMTIDSAHGDAIVLDAIIALAHRLKAKVIAEGVDQMAQLDYLVGRNVSYMQGFLYAKPMPCSEFVAWYATAGQQPLECGEAAQRVSGTTN